MKIRREDINFLYYLYRFRCLTLKQVNRYFYNDKSYYREKIIPMIKGGLISMSTVNDNYVVAITQKGVDLFQAYLNIPNEVYNAETGKIEKSTLKMKDVVVEDKYVNHQTSLNDFVLEFKDTHQDFEYYDEKYLSDMRIIRPDGLIKIKNNDLFLEQDMGTESYKQLCDKWNRYKRYLSTAFNDERKITVIFIVKCYNIESRCALVRKSILDTFNQIDASRFDIYIGSKEEMLKTVDDRIISEEKERTIELAKLLQKHNFKVSEGSKLKAKLGTVYGYYTLQFDKKKRLNYYNPNKKRQGKFTEFLVDFYDCCPISVLSKIYFHHKNAHNYDIAYSPKANLRLIDYIVVVRNIQEIYKHLEECDLLGKQRVFFTTPERLKTKRITQALFTFDSKGNVMTSSDLYFEATIKEGHISEYKTNGLKANGF